MRTALLPVFFGLLLGACVPKGKHLRELDAVKQAKAAVQTQLDLTQHRLANAQQALAHELQTREALQERLQELERQNRELLGQLQRLSEELATMGAEASASKQSLEAMVAQLQADAEAARRQAEEAAARAEELAAERERLAEEAERLRAEKEQLEATTQEYDALVARLEGEIEAGQVTITELSGKLTVNLSNAILFASGSTTLKPAGRAALAKVAEVLQSVDDREIRVEGHTDDVPVAPGAPYASNWELSALRASGAVRILVENGVDPHNIAAVGYGEYRPAVPNDSPANRARNRRTEIVLAPRLR